MDNEFDLADAGGCLIWQALLSIAADEQRGSRWKS